MNSRHLIRTSAVGLTCAAVGAGAGVLGSASGASPANVAHTNRGHAAAAGHLRALRRAVHADAVVPVAGGGFATVTYDRGFLTSVSGNQLTLREGNKKATYRSVTLTIPSGATVRLDRKPAQLAQLQVGDRVRVFHGPKRTRVAALDKQAPSTVNPPSGATNG